MTDSLLLVNNLDAGYGDFQALFGIDLHVAEGETVSIIGANGAGKTTLLRSIVGLVQPIAATSATTGVPSRRHLSTNAWPMESHSCPRADEFSPALTVEENIIIGGDIGRPGPWTKLRVLEAFPLLNRLLRRSGEGLSGGERQTLAIARALMSNPRLLLLDEVSLGLAPIVVRQVYEAVPVIKAQGTTVLIVEQDVNQALAVADRFYCLLEGRIALTGVPRDVSKEQITEAYFGMSGRNH